MAYKSNMKIYGLIENNDFIVSFLFLTRLTLIFVYSILALFSSLSFFFRSLRNSSASQF